MIGMATRARASLLTWPLCFLPLPQELSLGLTPSLPPDAHSPPFTSRRAEKLTKRMQRLLALLLPPTPRVGDEGQGRGEDGVGREWRGWAAGVDAHCWRAAQWTVAAKALPLLNRYGGRLVNEWLARFWESLSTTPLSQT